MSSQLTRQSKSYPAELRDLFERGNAGDASVLPALQRAFDEHPALAEMLGDMPRLALEPLLAAVAGKSLTLREAIRRQSDQLLEGLAGPDASLPERMIAERVALAWIEVHHADAELAAALKKRTPESPQMQAAERRAQSAQVRYLDAIEALIRAKRYSLPSSTWGGWPMATTDVRRQDRAGSDRSGGEIVVTSA